jgi:hypothetical protein
VRSERTRHADLALRTDLLDMAKAIAQTRAEVTEVMPTAGRVAAARADTPRDLFAAAERRSGGGLDHARTPGLDFATCTQIEELGSRSCQPPRCATRRPPRAKTRRGAGYLEARIGGSDQAWLPPRRKNSVTGPAISGSSIGDASRRNG